LDPAAGNLIAANGTDGILLMGSGVTGTLVQGNGIGTPIPGGGGGIFTGVNLGNAHNGIQIMDAAGNTIGGTTAAASNLIAGNRQDGVLIIGADSKANR